MNVRPHTQPIALSAVASALGSHYFGDDVLVTGITHDSRSVQPGDLYVAIPGFARHGIEFIEEAISRGAVAIASDAYGVEQASLKVPSLVLNSPRSDMAFASAEIYGHPERGMKLIGVTGTNGKTTITHMARSILMDAGHSVGLIGTVGTFINDVAVQTVRTTPESPELFALLAVMRERGVEIVAMEVSSHALVLGRVAGITFDVALFTNLSQDHLDFHETMDAYFAAKSTLFADSTARQAIICTDDQWGSRLFAESVVPRTSIGTHGETRVTDIVLTDSGTEFAISEPGGTVRKCFVPLLGAFNAINAAMTLSCVELLGVPRDTAIAHLARVRQIPGRFELVNVPNGSRVVIDYAHTPDAVDKVLDVIRETTPNRIVTVIGCGGDRDAAKRPLMGAVAARHSDVVIVTDDNPRSESPETIRRAILDGIKDSLCEVVEIGDRAEAIRYALSLTQMNDVVAVLGKGHEMGQERNGVVAPFSDLEEVQSVIAHV